MYVCLCHGISDREIRSRCASAPCSVAEIYLARGVAPKCGKCVASVKALLAETKASKAPVLVECGDTSEVEYRIAS